MSSSCTKSSGQGLQCVTCVFVVCLPTLLLNVVQDYCHGVLADLVLALDTIFVGVLAESASCRCVGVGFFISFIVLLPKMSCCSWRSSRCTLLVLLLVRSIFLHVYSRL